MSNASNKDLLFDADELIKIADTITEVIDQLSEACITNFSKMKSNPFYISGRATEEIDKIVSKDGRVNAGESDLNFAFNVAGDYYGKLQMLSQYYNLLSEYCFNVMIEVQEKDEKIAKYIQQLQNDLIGGV